MTTRSCVYKDCDYFYSVCGSTPTKGPWTIFSFPKQPERARIWFENAQVHPKVPKSQLFLCSKHFDSKFISITKNRTVLVGEAIPFPYMKKKDPDPEEEYCAAQDNFCIDLSGDEHDELTDEAKENTESTSEELQNDMEAKIETDLKSPSAKRLRESRNATPVASGPASTEICSADSDPDNIEAIDASEVSVFQFKGQEYVQMSMEFYMNEKRKMAELVKEYKVALRNIKDEVSRLKV